MHVRLADDLQQRHAAAVQIHQRVRARHTRPVLHVEQLAGVFFEMHAAHANLFGAGSRVNQHPAVRRQRQFVLRDLIAFGQVGIKIILAREDVLALDLAIERQPHANGELDGAAVDHRQRARLAGADGANVAVRFGGRRIHDGAAAEHFRSREQFGVDFESNDRFVIHV